MKEKSLQMTLLFQAFNLRPFNGSYGFEIELESTTRNSFPKNLRDWHTTNDGSLRHYGIEYVSNGERATFHEAPIIWRHLIENLLSSEYSDRLIFENRGGIHIHRNLQRLNPQQFCLFFCILHFFEDTFVYNCHPDRVGNHFCIQTCDAISSLEYFIYSRSRDAWSSFQRGYFVDQVPQENKYGAINWSCLSSRGSVELRCLESTLDFQKIMSFINTMEAIYKFSTSINDIDFIRNILSADIIDNPVGVYEQVKNTVDTINNPVLPFVHKEFQADINMLLSSILTRCPSSLNMPTEEQNSILMDILSVEQTDRAPIRFTPTDIYLDIFRSYTINT